MKKLLLTLIFILIFPIRTEAYDINKYLNLKTQLDSKIEELNVEIPYKKLNLKVNGYIIPEEVQQVAYMVSNGKYIKYILHLSLISNESNPENAMRVSYNENGTYDVGWERINSSNFKAIKKKYKLKTDEEVVELLKDPLFNLMEGDAIINKYWNLSDHSLFDTLVCYNAGTKSLYNLRKGEYGIKCVGSLYSQKIIETMCKYHQHYTEN